MRTETAELAVASLSSKATYTGGSVSIVYGIVTSNGFAVLVGVVVTLVTAFVNWHYKRKSEERARLAEQRALRAHERDEELHALRLEYAKRGLKWDDAA